MAGKMENEQAKEWKEAQDIKFSIDLVEAAKKVLKFLATVDQNRHLYDDHVLVRAIYRYNAFWLPLLAKHMENPVCGDEPLVVPLDCEWIWHCHRLNPLRYLSDCKKIFGKILSNRNTISLSSAEATSKSATEAVWKEMYPNEPYELDMTKPFSETDLKNEKFTSYDLVAAVKRQISFTYQISRPYVTDDVYLEEAVARYKGFLHMVRTNDKRTVKFLCVPTYDIDLIWHTHQLHPVSYVKDLMGMVGRVLHHNDTDNDRSPGKPLSNGFSQITQQWDESFGKSYWKAGTLYKGNSPTPVTHVPVVFDSNVKDDCGSTIQFSSIKVVEVLLEFVEIKNLPEDHKGNLVVHFSKKQADRLNNTKRSLAISSQSGEKNVASFQCEPTGEFLFELKELTKQKSMKLLGICSLSLEELTTRGSQLWADKWLSVQPASGELSSEPILLRTRISFTPPVPAPRVFHLAQVQHLSKVKNAEIPTLVLDQVGKEVLSLQIRSAAKDSVKEVYGVTGSGEQHMLAEFTDNHWFVKGSNGSLKLQNNPENDDVPFELVGSRMVKLFAGMRLDFETVPLEKQTHKKCFVTAVEFSSEYPYGKAVAMIDFASETVKATEEWMILPSITVAFLLSDILKEEIDEKTKNDIRYGIANMKMLKNGALAKLGQCAVECFGPCGHVENALAKDVITDKNVLMKAGFADCAKCYLCGVPAVDADIAKDAFADCAKCYLCGVPAADDGIAKDAFADCAKCYLCGVPAADADIAKDAFADCAKCYFCCCPAANAGIAKDAFADCSKCYLCSSPDANIAKDAFAPNNDGEIVGAGCYWPGTKKASGAGCFWTGGNKASGAPCMGGEDKAGGAPCMGGEDKADVGVVDDNVGNKGAFGCPPCGAEVAC